MREGGEGGTMTVNKAGKLLEDLDVNVKIKLSGLWAALMFFYLYRDVLGFMEPGHVEDLLAGELAGVRMTQAVLLGSAVLMAIPSIMVFLSLVLKAKANRWANVFLGVIHIAILGGTFFVGEVSALYAFYAIAVLLLIVVIVWHAWKWPEPEELVPDSDSRLTP
jgi:poly(A) polymerase Pap1